MKDYFKFLGFIKPHWVIFSLAILCMIVSALFEASPLAMIIPLIDVIISGKAVKIPDGVNAPQILQDAVSAVNAMPKLELLYIMTAAIVVIFILKGVFMFLQTYLMSDVSERVIRDVKDAIYKKLVQQSMDFFGNNPTGVLMARITHDATVIRDAIGTGVADTFYKPIELLVYFCVVLGVKVYFGIPWKLIIVGTVLFPLIMIPVRQMSKRLRDISYKTQQRIADINNMLLETIAGMKLVKAFNMENYERGRFEKHNQMYYRLNMKAVKRMKIISPLTETTAVICVAIILAMTGKSIISGELSAGAFAAFLAAIFSMMKPVKRLSAVYTINQQALAAAERIFQILDAPVSIQDKPGAVEFQSFSDRISLEKVFFKYREEGDYVLNDINLTVKKGEIIALVGPSGGGKSTLVNLIPRFYDPNKGRICIDGIDLKDMQVASLRDKIGMVTQETLLFNDTVKANLSYGDLEVDEEKLVRAAETANAHEFIREFPEGYNTIIGERGLKISGGQRQRIAIARAVYKNPPILILDEATSQLDTESEKLVQEAINKLMMGRTVIVIAHRLSTIMHADKIVVINDGRMIDIGTHKDLLGRNPLYQKLYEMQFANENT